MTTERTVFHFSAYDAVFFFQEQVAYDDPDKKIYHLCIVNLVIGLVMWPVFVQAIHVAGQSFLFFKNSFFLCSRTSYYKQYGFARKSVRKLSIFSLEIVIKTTGDFSTASAKGFG